MSETTTTYGSWNFQSIRTNDSGLGGSGKFEGSQLTGSIANNTDTLSRDAGGDRSFTINGTQYTYLENATAGGTGGFTAQDATGKTYFFWQGSSSFTTADQITRDGPTGDKFLLCFMPGTLIRTPDGEAAVETLKAGDAVLTAEGRRAAIRWVGRQTVNTLFADPTRTLPVRIRAGALGEGLPHRDLLVSPGHAMLVDGMLISAAALVNDTSILREQDVPASFTYFHIELPEHDLVLAEGAPAESFVDNASRENFDNWEEHEALHGPAPIAEMPLPRANSARQVPETTRKRLAAIAAGLSGATAIAA